MARKPATPKLPSPTEDIENQIFILRGKRVMLDTDLARLYDVATKRLNEQVRRNPERFPEDFAFQPTDQELRDLKSQFATSSASAHGGRRKPPLVFTEHGALMAAAVLNSTRAVEVSVYVVRAFVKLRELAAAHKILTDKLNELEHKVTGHDQAIAELINAIRQLMTPPDPKQRRSIGYAPWEEGR